MKDKAIEISHAYDEDVDAIFIHKVESYDYDVSVELTNNIIVDFNNVGQFSALEILNASKVFGVSKDALMNIGSICMKTGVTEKLICVKLSIAVLIQNKELSKSFDHFAINDINAPVMETELVSA